MPDSEPHLMIGTPITTLLPFSNFTSETKNNIRLFSITSYLKMVEVIYVEIFCTTQIVLYIERMF